MTTQLILLLAFAAVAILAQTTMSLFSGASRTRRVNRRLALLESGLPQDEVYSRLIRKADAPRFVGKSFAGAYAALDLACRQAGLSISPARLALYTLGAAVGLWLAGMSIITARGGGLLVDGPASFVGSALIAAIGAWFWLNRRRTARLKQLTQQLPLALDVISRAIRAGHPVIAAVQLAAEELGDPLGSEFGLIVDETTYGAEFTEALSAFARRTGSQDAQFFAVAVSIQMETGGNLAEILDALSKVMRGRLTLVKKVKALSSEGMASAYILSALPALMVGFTMATNPRTYTDKFSDPVFWPIVTVVLALYFCGWLMIRKITHFKY